MDPFKQHFLQSTTSESAEMPLRPEAKNSKTLPSVREIMEIGEAEWMAMSLERQGELGEQLSEDEWDQMEARWDFDKAVANRIKYGVPLDRPCPWMVVLIKQLNEHGKFPCDKTPHEAAQAVKAWLTDAGFDEDEEVRFEVIFLSALVNPRQDMHHIQSSDPSSSIGSISIQCSGFGNGKKDVSVEDLAQSIESVLSETENPFIEYVSEKLNPPKPQFS